MTGKSCHGVIGETARTRLFELIKKTLRSYITIGARVEAYCIMAVTALQQRINAFVPRSCSDTRNQSRANTVHQLLIFFLEIAAISSELRLFYSAQWRRGDDNSAAAAAAAVLNVCLMVCERQTMVLIGLAVPGFISQFTWRHIKANPLPRPNLNSWGPIRSECGAHLHLLCKWY